MAERERKHQTKKRKDCSNYIYSSPSLLSSLSIIDGKGSISVLQIHKIHFWALSITYYLVKMSFKCWFNYFSSADVGVFISMSFQTQFNSSLSLISHIHSITKCQGFYLWNFSQEVISFSIPSATKTNQVTIISCMNC